MKDSECSILLNLRLPFNCSGRGLTEPRPPSQANGGRGLNEWCSPTARWRPYRCLPLGRTSQCLFGLFAVLNGIEVLKVFLNFQMFLRVWRGDDGGGGAGCWGDGLAFFFTLTLRFFLNGPMMACRYTAHVGQAQNCHGQELDQPYGWIWN